MNAETETFIRDLFARCLTRSPVTFLTLSAIHPDGDRPTPSRHVPLGDWAALDRAVQRLLKANEHGWGAYIGIAPRQRDLGRWSRGGKADLACLPALFVDIDEPDQALVRLGWFDLPASFILHSGRGYHAFWLLRTPTTDFSLADRALHGLARQLEGDEALSVAQSMRLAGTLNTKPDRNGARCSFVGYHPERLYDLYDFTPFLSQAVQPIRRRPAWSSRSVSGHDAVIDELTEAVLHDLEGHYRANGFIAARCPLPHLRDKPGMHFSYWPDSGCGHCFGKHGKIPFEEMRHLLIPHHNAQTAAVRRSAA